MPVLFEVMICIAIFSARIVDVSLDTLRLFAVVNGRRGVAWLLAFFQVMIWLAAVSSVISNIDEKPWYAVAYALGYATGNYVGISIEQLRARGEQVVRVFSRKGSEIAAVVRGEGYGVTEFDGRGKDGPVIMLFIETPRRDAMKVARQAQEMDPDCYFVVDDVRATSDGLMPGVEPPIWRRFLGRRDGQR